MQRTLQPSASPGAPRALTWLVRLPRVQAWTLVLLCLDLAAIGDLATGPELWFGPVYLCVMCVATWSLGWRAGQATGIGCMALTFAINGISLYPYGSAEIALNAGMRFVALSVVIVVIAGVRRAYVREWWLARTDPLTGALNRQAFFEIAAPFAGSRGWVLLAYADLDGLKQVNDHQGHAMGDACLVAFAAAVRRMIRRDDVFARVGGDEFVIGMRVRDERAALEVAARLHAGMNRVPSPTGAQLRCSLGALVVPPGGRSLDELVRLADNLMYEAKQRGACLELGTAAEAESGASAGRARRLPRRPGDAAEERRPEVERRGPMSA